jgi:hypothetical protein
MDEAANERKWKGKKVASNCSRWPFEHTKMDTANALQSHQCLEEWNEELLCYVGRDVPTRKK